MRDDLTTWQPGDDDWKKPTAAELKQQARGEFWENTYMVVAYIVGIVTFLGCWLYAIATFGWFLGLGLGWIPSLFIAYLVGFVWPLIALGGIILFAYQFR